MGKLTVLKDGMNGFISKEFIPEGKDAFYIRNIQNPLAAGYWRNLLPEEIDILIRNNNFCDDWNQVFVSDPFFPELFRNNSFSGQVRIGKTEKVMLESNGLKLPAGITNSRIVSCDIGENVAMHDVGYISHFIVGNYCILFQIKEMLTTGNAKFGSGIIKEGETEDCRNWIELVNESGSRKILAFEGITTADAYLWAKYRDEELLLAKLKEITQNTSDQRRGFFGTTGNYSIIKNSGLIRDIKAGGHCTISGAAKLDNLAILSSSEEDVFIGEGSDLVNGIIGPGCHISGGSKALNFLLGNNSNLKFGARLINTFLGDNSTISCCEVQNNLIFPAHEQHHNNSFLIASLLMGQSNIAAGATIGSNHNSRAADNEIEAGRGFWPGLCTSIKHPSRFASFTLLAKGDYPYELNIPLPFSLIINNVSKDRLEIIPAFWWTNNMYALERNSRKFKSRDKRHSPQQNIEFDSLAPDTVEEIINACRLLEIWTARADFNKRGDSLTGKNDNELVALGRNILNQNDTVKSLEVLGENIEKSKRPVIIAKAQLAYRAYHDMLHYYAVKNLLEYYSDKPEATFKSLASALSGERQSKWINFGGQLVPENDAKLLCSDILSGTLASWEEIHQRYQSLWKAYPLEKQKHAFATLCFLLQTVSPSLEQWIAALDKAAGIQDVIHEQVYLSRKKDFDNPFMMATYRNAEEMKATLGTIEDNVFVKQISKESDAFKRLLTEIKKRG